jgi:Uma2 family endonuclease
MVATRLRTIEDLEALPDDGHVYELIDGELVRRPDMGFRHGVLQTKVARLVAEYAEAHDLGEVAGADTIVVFRRDPDLGLRPDATFVRAERLPTGSDDERPLQIVPDLVIEVVSPNDLASDVDEKIEKYRRFRVPLIWILWPRRKAVTVYPIGKPPMELAEEDELDGGDVLPGFRVKVADLFRRGKKPR